MSPHRFIGIVPVPATAPTGPTGPADAAAIKGRGTAWALPHRFETISREPDHDAAGRAADDDDDPQGDAERPGPATEVAPEIVRSIIATNDSPDIGFEASINPYRGCEHGCIYCYARPTHGYLNLSPGLDFETRLSAKVNAAERLREALGARGYRPRPLHIAGITDGWQPAERRFRITRGVLEVLAEARHPLTLITKSALVERDLDLLAPMARAGLVSACVSITTLDPALARVLEPRAAAPRRRLRTIERLAAAGVPVGVSVSPLIPFVNEPELEKILAAARAAGAGFAFGIVLRLPWEVAPLFEHWLQQHLPGRAARVMARLREMRGGRDNDARFGTRMTGQGVWAELLRQRFAKARDRLGLARHGPELDVSQFRPPAAQPGQGSLF